MKEEMVQEKLICKAEHYHHSRNMVCLNMRCLEKQFLCSVCVYEEHSSHFLIPVENFIKAVTHTQNPDKHNLTRTELSLAELNQVKNDLVSAIKSIQKILFQEMTPNQYEKISAFLEPIYKKLKKLLPPEKEQIPMGSGNESEMKDYVIIDLDQLDSEELKRYNEQASKKNRIKQKLKRKKIENSNASRREENHETSKEQIKGHYGKKAKAYSQNRQMQMSQKPRRGEKHQNCNKNALPQHSQQFKILISPLSPFSKSSRNSISQQNCTVSTARKSVKKAEQPIRARPTEKPSFAVSKINYQGLTKRPYLMSEQEIKEWFEELRKQDNEIWSQILTHRYKQSRKQYLSFFNGVYQWRSESDLIQLDFLGEIKEYEEMDHRMAILDRIKMIRYK